MGISPVSDRGRPVCDDRLMIKLNADGQIVTGSPFISEKVKVDFKSRKVNAVLFEWPTEPNSRVFARFAIFNVGVLPLIQFSNTFWTPGVNGTEIGTSFACSVLLRIATLAR